MSDERTESSPGGPLRDEESETRILDDEKQKPTVINASMAPTVVDQLEESTGQEVPVPAHVADAIESPGQERSASGPSTLVEPSSASSRITGDFREQARKLRETWDPPPDDGLAERLGSTFEPDPPAKQIETPGEPPKVEPMPQIDSAVLEANAVEAARNAAREARAAERRGSGAPEDEHQPDGEPDEESIEEKKERMRAYMDADREIDSWKNSRRRGGKGFGGLGCLMRTFLILALVAGVGALIWAWHPWKTEVVMMDAREHPGICSPGVRGTRTVEYFTLFGVRLGKSGESTMCVE